MTEGFVEELSEHLDPGGAAMIMLVREMDLERLLARIEVQGHVIRTTLSRTSRPSLTLCSRPPSPTAPEPALVL